MRAGWPRLLAALVSMAILVPVNAPAVTTAAPAVDGCGLTTLDGTIRFGEEARSAGELLRCGPGEAITVRSGLAPAQPGRAERRRSLISFFTIADVQLADEEAPARAEWLDKCGDHPASSAFRPHETMVPHLLNAHLQAASKIAKRGAPITRDGFDFAVGLGDLADNMQFNELRWIIDLFDGGQIVDPDSGKDDAVAQGGDRYHGVQSTDPVGSPAHPVASPVEGQRIVELANEPFWAHGLRGRDKRVPWYSVPGNHDVKVQGTAPNEGAWLRFINTYNQGHSKVLEPIDEDDQQRACEGGFADPGFMQQVLSNPQYTRTVPADDRRRIFVNRHGWARQHFETKGRPVGHGYNEGRCRNREGELLARLCYSFTKGPFHFIALDSNPDEGLESGNIDHPQWKWLKRELRANSRFFYRRNGKPRRNPDARNKMIIVFAHHPVESMDNTSTERGHTGRQFVELLLRFPNVIANANGHTHKNRIWARRSKDLGTRYWELNTSAIADYPTQSRTVEIVDNRDGTLSIFAVVFNADVEVDPRQIEWAADDPTHEVDHGHDHNINEEWLASFGQEVLFYDPQQDLAKIGRPRDRNVELLLRTPRWLRR